jgi:hypothetical protein
MKCKDIPDMPILLMLERLNGKWAFMCDLHPGEHRSILEAMPQGVPWKLALAKMRRLMDRGLVLGCGCGCRGDFEITQRGREFIAQQRSKETSA